MSEITDNHNSFELTNSDVFLYMPDERSLRGRFRTTAVMISLGAVAVVIILIVIPLIYSLSLGSEGLNYLGCLGSLIAIVGSVCFAWRTLVATAAFLVASSDIALKEEGIQLQLIGAWSMLVPRESLRDMTILKTKFLNPFDKPRWRRKYELLLAFHVPHLTFLHKLAGLHYRLGLSPIFLVTPNHDKYKLLLEKLRQAALEQGCDPENLAW